jgi:hypothetical protein
MPTKDRVAFNGDRTGMKKRVMVGLQRPFAFDMMPEK